MLLNAAKCQTTTFTVPELLRENQQGGGVCLCVCVCVWGGMLKLHFHEITVNKLCYFYLVSHKFLQKIIDIMNLKFSLLYVTWLLFSSYIIFIESATGCQFFPAVLFHHYFVVNFHKRDLLLLQWLILCLLQIKNMSSRIVPDMHIENPGNKN